MVFDPVAFDVEVHWAKEIRRQGLVTRLAASEREEVYEVERDAYLVFLDLAGSDAHYCTCPDGATKVEVAFLAGSLCEHVIACLLEQEHAHMLAPHFALAAKARPQRVQGRARRCTNVVWKPGKP